MSIKSCFSVIPGIIRHTKLLNINQFKYAGGVASVKTSKILNYSTERSEYKEVYYGVLTPQIKAVKYFSLSSSIVGIIGQPFLYDAIAKTGNIPIIIIAYSFIGFFTFITPLFLHFITKKYVILLLYKPRTDTYVATTINFFCLTKSTEFKAEDVKIPDVPGMFTSFLAKGKPLFLDPRMFTHPHHYARIMGYDKPMDFKMSDGPAPDKKE